MNRAHALRYFLLKHLWRNRWRVEPEVHREIARTLRIKTSENGAWRLFWKLRGKEKIFDLQGDAITFYRRGDLAGSPPAEPGSFDEIAESFVTAAFGKDSQAAQPLADRPRYTSAILRTAVWTLAGVGLASAFQLPPVATCLLAACMVVELWLPRGRLILAGLSLPFPLLLGLPGALLHLQFAILQFLDPWPRWRRLRVSLHCLGLFLGIVSFWHHRDAFSLATMPWPVLPALVSVAVATARWVRLSHRHMAPLAIPGVVLGLGCIGHFPAAVFLTGCAAADWAVGALPSWSRVRQVFRNVMDDPRTPSPHVAALLGVVCAFLAGLAWWMGLGAEPDGLERFSPEIVTHMRMIDTGDRRLAHKLLLALLPFAALFGAFLLHRRRLLAPRTPLGIALRSIALLRGPAAIALAAAVLWLTCSSLPKTDLLNILGGRFGLLYTPSPAHYLLLVGASFLGLMAIARWRPLPGGRKVRLAAWSLVWLYLAAALLPGLMIPAPLGQLDDNLFNLFSNHHGIIFGDAAQLANGQQIHTDVRIMYGVLRAAALAAWMLYVAPLNVADGVMLLKIGQVLVCLAAVFLARGMAPRRPLVVFLTLALLTPWFHTMQSGLLFPNHAGWRFSGYVFGFLAALATGGWPAPRRSILLGAVGAFFILLNTETGLCLSLGLLCTLLFSLDSLTLRRLAVAALGWITGCALVFAAFIGLYAAAIGPVPPLLQWIRGLDYFRQGASGFAGRPFYFDPFALLICAHWIWIVLHSGLRRLARPLGRLESMRGGLAVTGLLWLAYFVNGTSRQYLAGLVLLYAFFLSSYCAPPLLRFLRPKRVGAWVRFTTLRPITFAVVVGPMILAGNIQLGATLWYNLARPLTAATMNISGTTVPAPIGKVLQRRIAFLSTQPDRMEIVYVSAFGRYIQAETGLPSRLPMAEPYMMSYARDDMDRIIARISQLCPQRILVDNRALRLHPMEQAFQDRFISRIEKFYRFDREEADWRIFVLTDH